MPVLQQIDRTYVVHEGKKLSYFSGCDYFRLASHPAVLRACQSGLKLYGLNVAASRLTTGNHVLYEELEERLAKFFGAAAAVLFSSGYAVNIGVAQALAGEFTDVLIDERAHLSLIDAVRWFDCPVRQFKHRDPDSVRQLVRRIGASRRILLATDGVFAFDGSVAPLQEYSVVLPDNSWILVDDAHAAGVLGKCGRGTPEYSDIQRTRLIQTITLSKAFGVYGGAVLAPRKIANQIVTRSRYFAGNTPLPLPLAAGALTALDLVGQGVVRQRLNQNVEQVKHELRRAGHMIPDNPSPMFSITPSSTREARRWAASLLRNRIYPSLTHYPGFPEQGCFRFALSSEHTPEQMKTLIACVCQW